MVCGVRGYLAGSGVLVVLAVLAGCSGGSFFVEREPWRHEAEAQCLSSGAVKEGVAKVRIKAINGPGMCGADFPFKVSALGGSAALGYGDELRPPASIPNSSAPPRWPVRPARAPPPYEAPSDRSPPPQRQANPPIETRTLAPPRSMSAPLYDGVPRHEAPPPLPLDPPAAVSGPTYQPYDFRKPYTPLPAPRTPADSAPVDANSPAYDLSPEPYDRRRVIEEPPIVPIGPSRGPEATASAGPVTVSPAATLACPIVSVLDRWIAESVQPAALHWFGQPVVEIRQISAYSCRGMNGNPNARISEHAFGNALDIASFTLADGYRLTVEKGWHGTPEEQGFLRDVQGAACEQFTTVLAPGSNRYHYNHIHVDLMRRAGGRRACNPHAVSGEEVAARARSYFARRGEPSVTGSISGRKPAKRLPPTAYADERPDRHLPDAVPGEDGED